MPSPARPDRLFEARADLDTRVLPGLRELPYFREASTEELERSFAAYSSGDVEALLRVWREVAAPTRATMPPRLEWAYARAGLGPRAINAEVFLDSVSAALGAGERFRERLSPALRAILHTEFPYLERRHEHVPPLDQGETGGNREDPGSAFEFPDAFAAFLETGELDDARARWQLAVAINEVQQCCYSEFAATHFRVPELARHAERERELARNYFGHWSPRCTYDLWRETIYVLDALNAATFELVCVDLLPRAMSPARLLGGRRRAARARWQAFVAGLDQPQWLLAPDS